MIRCIGLVVVFALAALVVNAKQLDGHRARYRAELARIETEHTNRREEALNSYAAALEAIRRQVQAAGELGLVQAVLRETRRFQTDRTLPAPGSEPFESVGRAAEKSRAALGHAQTERARRIATLADQYVRALDNLMRDMTRQGHIERAVAVRKEMESVGACETVRAARGTLEEQQPAVATADPKATEHGTVATAAEEEDAEPEGLALARMYKGGLAPPKSRMAELRSMLHPHASAGTDLGPHPDIEIYKGVTYLSNVEEALQTLTGRRLSSQASVTTPGMPRHSLRRHTATLREGGFNKLIVLADQNQQVVGIQLTAENPATPQSLIARPGHSLFNIAENRAVSNPKARVHWNTTSDGRVVVVRSAMWDHRNRLQESSVLYLAKPFADVVMDVIESY